VGIVYSISNYKPETEQDQQFKARVTVTYYKIKEISDNIQNAAGNYDMDSVQYWCGQLRISADVSRKMIKECDVSYDLFSVKIEYLAYLDDIYHAGECGEQGDLDNFLYYATGAKNHLIVLNDLI